jgi:hypothetical protein
MERLIALRDLYNPAEYGRAYEGHEFECSDSTARQLLQRGSARRASYDQNIVVYETKVIYPEAPEVSARDPFCHVPGLNPQSPDLASESDPVLPVANIQEPGIADRGKRAGRKTSDSGK